MYSKIIVREFTERKKGECERDVKKYSDERKKIQVKFFLNKKEMQTRWSENAGVENSDERKKFR